MYQPNPQRKCSGERRGIDRGHSTIYLPEPRSDLTSHPCHYKLTVVIRSFRHRGLKRLWEGDPSRISAVLRDRIENALAVLDAAAAPADLDLPGYRLHALRGDLKGTLVRDPSAAIGGLLFASSMAMRST